MANLSPCPLAVLVRRMFREHEARGAIFDLPASSFVTGDTARDYSVTFHDRIASTPFGPAAGPHSQLAQNIVLSWLAGGRIIELKTVQQNDRLTIPRPCIDVRTVGFNVEWSQELTLEQSLEEYVKAAMLIEMLAASGRIPLAPGFGRTIYDISVGYDLASITSDRVLTFIRGMRDAREVIDRLRSEVPHEWRRYADLPFEPCVAASVTLSTFHGCPAGEIERIALFLLRELGMATVVKLNPTLLGRDAVEHLLHDELGYADIRVPPDAFDSEIEWDEMCRVADRLHDAAGESGVGFGVKLTNTLVVENDGDFLPAAEKRKYLSGPPLHVLAMHLVRRFRRQFGWRIPLSFSGGIDRVNFPDAVALGLVPVTVCTDFLRPGGYGRGHKYFHELARRMDAVGAASIGDFVVRAYGFGAAALEWVVSDGDERVSAIAALQTGGDLRKAVGNGSYRRWVAQAALLNTEVYLDRLEQETRYRREHNHKPPRKVGRDLNLFDCLACDKCVPVCPNDANFTFTVPIGELPVEKAWRENGSWRFRIEGAITIAKPRQIGTFSDLCNECGNCDVFCPEDGAPYQAKPRFFGSFDAWRAAAPLDGFYIGATADGHVALGRLRGMEYGLLINDGNALYYGPGFEVSFREAQLEETLEGEADREIDLTVFFLMNHLRKGVLSPTGVNFVNCLA